MTQKVQPKYRKRALQRYAYLLSKFAAVDASVGQSRRFVFTQDLPRAASLAKAVDAAMQEEGIELIPVEEFQDVTDRESFMAEALKNFFVAHSPQVNPTGDSSRFATTYLFGAARFIPAAKEMTLDTALANAFQYRPANAIEPVTVERESIYEAVHVALRKLCDSPATSAAWNALHLMEKERGWLVDFLYGVATRERYETVEALIDAAKRAVSNDMEYMGNAERALMHCLFRLFSDDDWAGMFGYIVTYR